MSENPPPSNFIPFDGAGLDIDLVQFGGVIDKDNGGANAFSLQLNTNQFAGGNSKQAFVQFAFQTQYQISPNFGIACIWNIDLDTNNYDPACIPLTLTRSPRAGDQMSITGNAADGMLLFTAFLPWATSAYPWASGGSGDFIFSISAPDTYNLEYDSAWNAVSGGFLGAGGGSLATLSHSCVTTSLVMNFLTASRPVNPPLPTVSTEGVTNTMETNNLDLVNAPLAGCVEGECKVEFDSVSHDWTQKGQETCYPQTLPAPTLPIGNQAGIFEDDGTQLSIAGTSVHICQNGAFVIGVDAANDRFLCSDALPFSNMTTLIADSTTHKMFTYNGEQHPVHVCPGTMVMVGWKQDKNWLICGQSVPSGFDILPGYGSVNVDGPGGTQVPEPKHPGLTMRACDPKGSGGPLAMIGIKLDDNVLICMNSGVTARLQ
jgi:hypothetical protein